MTDWSQFTPVAPQVDWSQFAPAPVPEGDPLTRVDASAPASDSVAAITPQFDAGAGRGRINPPMPTQAPQTSGSLAKDLAINAFGGMAGGLAGAGAAVSDAVGANDTAAALDKIRQNWQGVQKENGGDTISGKAADLVGAVAPALLVPEAKAAQLISNAGLFAIPAFRDTLKAKLDEGQSFPLALAHASESFGINLFMPTVATRGSGAVVKALGGAEAAGAKGAATALGQAAVEGAGFSAASSAIDKGTDVAAGQQNDNDWVNLKDMAASALGFTGLRAAHVAPQAASAVADRVGTQSQQFGRALGQDVDAAQFNTDVSPQTNPHLAQVEPKADPIQKIAQAGSVDEAIAAAQEAVSSTPVKAPEAQTVEQLLAEVKAKTSGLDSDLLAVRPLENADVSNAVDAGAAIQPSVDGRSGDVAGGESAGGLGDSGPVAAAEPARSIEPALAVEPVRGEPASVEPAVTWFGRAGDGYKTVGDAQMALPSRLKVAPTLDWKVEPMGNGKFRLAGYGEEGAKSSDASTQAKAAEAAPVNAPAEKVARVSDDRAAVTKDASPVAAVKAAPVAGESGGNNRAEAVSSVPVDVGAGPARAEVAPAGKPETISAFPPAPEVSRYNGKFGKGMGFDAARMEATRLNRKNDGITYAAEEHGDAKLENPYAVVGRRVETRSPEADERAAKAGVDARRATEWDGTTAKNRQFYADKGGLELTSRQRSALGDKKWADLSDAERNAASKGMQTYGTIEDGKVVAADQGALFSRKAVTGTDAFKAWFGKSKVVDEHGEPLVLYHGTDQSFDKFDGNSYFTPIPRDAATYSEVNTPGKEHAPNVMPVYLSMRKPKIIATYATRADIDNARLSGKYDGVIVKGVAGSKTDHYIAFKPEQIKSATGNRGTFDKSNPDITFKRDTTPADGEKTLHPTQIQRAVDKLTLNWLRKPDIHILDSMEDAPGPVRQVWERQNAQGGQGQIEGFHYKGGVYVVADAMHSGSDIIRVLYHESLGHFGLRQVFGDKLDSVLRQVAAVKAPEIRRKAQQYGFDMSNERQRMSAAEEVLAEMAQSRPTNSLVQKAIAVIRTFLRENVPGFEKLKMTDAEIVQNFLAPAREFVENGKRAEPSFMRGEEAQASRTKAAEAAPEDERKPYDGPGAKMIEGASNAFASVRDDLLNHVAPMSTGSQEARAAAQKFANDTRVSRHQWLRMSEMIKAKYSAADRKAMWDAADEQNTLMQEGKDTAGKGLDRLDDKQRATMQTLHTYADNLWKRAQSVGMVEGDGLPFWTPRMAVMVGEDGSFSKPGGEGKKTTSSGVGRNVMTTAPSAMHRKYVGTEESEAALKAKKGDSAEYVRDILTMPLAMSRFEQAIAGRELINQVKEIGLSTGRETVANAGGPDFFTLDHPAFTSYKPRMVTDADGKVTPALDQNGEMVFDKVPLFISKEFYGPLKAVMSTTDGTIYSGYMLLKSKAMTAIMASPLTHNMVIFGRALAYSPAQVGTGYLYWKGHILAKDEALMQQAIGHGLVPIGANKNSMMDITDVARGIGRQGSWGDPNESWVNLSMQKLGNALHEGTGDAIKGKMDALGDFVHHTLLWKQVGALQIGIYNDAYQYLTAKGLSDKAAGPLAAHLANRYAGAVGQENMSEIARKAANVMLFSRSFNMGNLGAMKDALYGMPAGLKAKMLQDVGELEGNKALSYARRKARATLIADVGLSVLFLSLAQSAVDKLKKDKSWDEIGQGYVRRLNAMVSGIGAHPLDITQYNPYRISPTFDNEPGKQDRVDMGEQPGGRHEYMRLPTGKVVEDMIGWAFNPGETFGKKMSPMAKSIWQDFTNDKGFGVPVKDPEGGFWKHVYDVSAHVAEAQLPLDSVKNIYDLSQGKATPQDKDRLAGFATGFSYSQGHPGGPEAQVAAKTQERMDASKKYVMEQVKRDLKYGDVDKATERLDAIGFTPREINQIIRRIEEPKSGLSGSARRKFNQHSNDAEKALMGQQR